MAAVKVNKNQARRLKETGVANLPDIIQLSREDRITFNQYGIKVNDNVSRKTFVEAYNNLRQRDRGAANALANRAGPAKRGILIEDAGGGDFIDFAGSAVERLTLGAARTGADLIQVGAEAIGARGVAQNLDSFSRSIDRETNPTLDFGLTEQGRKGSVVGQTAKTLTDVAAIGGVGSVGRAAAVGAIKSAGQSSRVIRGAQAFAKKYPGLAKAGRFLGAEAPVELAFLGYEKRRDAISKRTGEAGFNPTEEFIYSAGGITGFALLTKGWRLLNKGKRGLADSGRVATAADRLARGRQAVGPITSPTEGGRTLALGPEINKSVTKQFGNSTPDNLDPLLSKIPTTYTELGEVRRMIYADQVNAGMDDIRQIESKFSGIPYQPSRQMATEFKNYLKSQTTSGDDLSGVYARYQANPKPPYEETAFWRDRFLEFISSTKRYDRLSDAISEWGRRVEFSAWVNNLPDEIRDQVDVDLAKLIGAGKGDDLLEIANLQQKYGDNLTQEARVDLSGEIGRLEAEAAVVDEIQAPLSKQIEPEAPKIESDKTPETPEPEPEVSVETTPTEIEPDIPDRPDATVIEPEVKPENLPKQTFEQLRENIKDKKPDKINPRDVKIDAERFQFKSSDDSGTTEALTGIDSWDSHVARNMVFFRDLDGQLYVADGHQRINLYRRLDREGKLSRADKRRGFEGVILDAKEGWTPELAKEHAAFTNITAGTARPLDSATVLRSADKDIREALEQTTGAEPRRRIVAAQGIANLSDDAFKSVRAAINNNPALRDDSFQYVAGVTDDAAKQKTLVDALEVVQVRNGSFTNLEDARNFTEISLADINRATADSAQEGFFDLGGVNFERVRLAASAKTQALTSLRREANRLKTATTERSRQFLTGKAGFGDLNNPEATKLAVDGKLSASELAVADVKNNPDIADWFSQKVNDLILSKNLNASGEKKALSQIASDFDGFYDQYRSKIESTQDASRAFQELRAADTGVGPPKEVDGSPASVEAGVETLTVRAELFVEEPVVRGRVEDAEGRVLAEADPDDADIARVAEETEGVSNATFSDKDIDELVSLDRKIGRGSPYNDPCNFI